jgi:hypothetical protein
MSGVWLRSGTAGVGGCTCGPRRLHPGTASPYDALPEAVRLVADRPFTGDLDAMVQRRAIGVAVTFNRTHYFIDKGRERGITYEVLKSFEKDLNADLKTGSLKLHLVIVPMSSASLRNELPRNGHLRQHSAARPPLVRTLAGVYGRGTHRRAADARRSEL